MPRKYRSVGKQQSLPVALTVFMVLLTLGVCVFGIDSAGQTKIYETLRYMLLGIGVMVRILVFAVCMIVVFAAIPALGYLIVHYLSEWFNFENAAIKVLMVFYSCLAFVLGVAQMHLTMFMSRATEDNAAFFMLVFL